MARPIHADYPSLAIQEKVKHRENLSWLHKGRARLSAAPGLKNLLLSLQHCGADPAFVTHLHQVSRQGQPFPGCPSHILTAWEGRISSPPSLHFQDRKDGCKREESQSLFCAHWSTAACARPCTCVKGRMHFLRILQKMHPASSLLCRQPSSAEL